MVSEVGVGVRVGGWGCAFTSKSFDLLKIWVKSLKIRVKMAPNVACFKKWRPRFAEKTHEDLLWRSHHKKVLMIFVGENLQVKAAQKTFRASLGT